ncbi:MAG: PspC domain-containing protein [Bacillota bacterium]
MKKRLTRSKNNAMVAGVCSGIAEYFDLDPTIIRLAWVLFSFFGGSGLLVYLLCAFIVPSE